MEVSLTSKNFELEALKSETPVLIDFYADWCGPCRAMAPVIGQIAEEKKGVKVCKVNVDQEPELAKQFKVMSIPTLVVMNKGQVVNQAVGMQPKENIMKMIP